VTDTFSWVLVVVQLPPEPSRHRVAVWRELRKGGAVPVSPGTWALPAGPAFQPVLDRAARLAHAGRGVFAVMDVAPRDDSAAAMLREAFARARIEEWGEFVADCSKFEDEIEREIAKQKFTFAELEEEEQSLERLRRWIRDLRKRDVLGLPEAATAAARLDACAVALEGYTDLVYRALHGEHEPSGLGERSDVRPTTQVR
jgi:hypothetical protein